jgi:hypothetical protein
MSSFSFLLVFFQYREGFAENAQKLDKIGVPIELFLYGALMAALSGDREDSNVGANQAFRAANCKAVAESHAADELKCADLFTGDTYSGVDPSSSPVIDLTDLRPAAGLAAAGAIFYFVGYILNHVLTPSLKYKKDCGLKGSQAEHWPKGPGKDANIAEKFFWGLQSLLLVLFVHPSQHAWRCAMDTPAVEEAPTLGPTVDDAATDAVAATGAVIKDVEPKGKAFSDWY